MPDIFYLYNTYYTPYEPYITPLRRYLYLSQSYFYRYFFPYIWPLYRIWTKIIGKVLTDTPDFAALALLAVIVLVSIKVLDMLRKSIIYWLGLALRLALWAMVAGVGVYVWQRGFEQSIEDLGWVMGFLEGLGDEGERIGQNRAYRKAGDARRMPRSGPRGRTRGGGWT